MNLPSKVLTYFSIKCEGDWDKIYYELIHNKKDIPPEELDETIASQKCKILTFFDDDYPEYLKNTYKPPFVLYYYGDISLIGDYQRNVAVVGSRKYSQYGKEMTELLVGDISKNFIIVSGLAEGIDCIAHECTIAKGGKTVGILGTGIDYCYPLSSARTYREIKENHLLLSEYPGKVSGNFPMRNRLIAACSFSIIITDARIRSGTSITSGFGLEMGREIYCVPHSAEDESLCNRLIMQGANLVESPQDFYDQISSYIRKKLKEIY